MWCGQVTKLDEKFSYLFIAYESGWDQYCKINFGVKLFEKNVMKRNEK